MILAERCYEAARLLPPTERFGLAFQIRRAAVSVPSNIAEGHQLPTGSYRHHVCVAQGSVAELQTQFELAHRLGLLQIQTVTDIEQDLRDVRKMLVRLRVSLEP